MWNLLHRLLRDALTNGKDEPEEQVLLVTCLGLACLLVRDAGRRLPVGGKGNGAVAPSALLHLESRTLLIRRISERDLILAISLQLALDVHQRVEQMAGQLPPDEGGHQSSSELISRNQSQSARGADGRAAPTAS